MVIKIEFKAMKKEYESSFPFNSYYLYEFQISDNEDYNSYKPISMFIRYSKVHSFNSFLENKYPFEIFPNFPKKFFFETNSALNERAKNLENYFNKLLSSNNNEIINEVENFINLYIKNDDSELQSLNSSEEINEENDNSNIVYFLLNELNSNDSMISEIINNFFFQK